MSPRIKKILIFSGLAVFFLVTAFFILPAIIKWINTPKPLVLVPASKESGYQFQAEDEKLKFLAYIGELDTNNPKVKATTAENKSVEFMMTGLNKDLARPDKSGNKLVFKDVRDDIDLSYQTLVNGIKEEIIIKKPKSNPQLAAQSKNAPPENENVLAVTDAVDTTESAVTETPVEAQQQPESTESSVVEDVIDILSPTLDVPTPTSTSETASQESPPTTIAQSSAPTQDYIFSFDLNVENLHPIKESTNSSYFSPIFYDGENNYAFHFEKPFAIDNKGVRTDNAYMTITQGINGNDYFLNIYVDPQWLSDPDRAYPVRIDPTLVYQTSADFATGQFNRIVDSGNPNLTTGYQELSSDQHTVALWHMNEASGTTAVSDSSGNGYTGTSTSSTNVTTGNLNNARSFNGTNESISIATSGSLTGTFTVEAWAKVADTSARTILGSRSGADYSFDMKFSGGNLIHADIGNGTAWITTSADASFVYSTNTWYHVVYVVTPTGYYIYVNGSLVGSGSYANNLPLLYDSTRLLKIGQNSQGTEFFSGTIDEVRVSKIARTSEEIRMAAQRRPYGVYTSDVIDLNATTSAFTNLKWSELGAANGNPETVTTTNIVTDSFNRADNATTIGSADTGQRWNVNKGKFYITSNTAKTTGCQTNCFATVDTSVTDGVLTVTGPTVAQDGMVVFRYIDENNYYSLNMGTTPYSVSKKVNGSGSQIGGNGIAGANGDTARIEYIGSSIKVYIYRAGSIVQTYNITDSSLSGTRAGFGTYNNESMTWDDFKVDTAGSAGLVAQWNLNETSGTTAANNAGVCGTSCNGTLTNFDSTASQDANSTSTWTANNKRWGVGAAQFDGTDSYIACTDANCGGSGKLDFSATESFSYGAWFKTKKSGVVQFIMGKQATYNATIGWSMWIFSNDKVFCNIYDATHTGWSQSSVTVTDGNWHYAVCNINRATNEINEYIDGRNVGLAYISGYGALDTTSDFRIGDQGSGGTSFKGVIDSTSVYSRVQTANEILSNYNAVNVELQTRVGDDNSPNDGSWEAWKPTTSETAIEAFDSNPDSNNNPKLLLHGDGADTLTTFVDSSYPPHNLTANGNTQIDTAQSKFGGSSMLFDGTGDYISTPRSYDWNFGSGDFTIDFWVRFNTLPALGGGTNVAQNIVTQTSSNTFGWQTKLWVWSGDNTNYRLNIYARDGVGQIMNVDRIWSTPVINTWYHIAYVRSGSNLSMYVNGSILGTPAAGQSGTMPNVPADLWLGSSQFNIHASGAAFNGWLDEVRLTKGLARWTSDFTAPSSAYENPTVFSTSTDTVIKTEGTGSEKITTGQLPVDGNTVGLWRLDETGGTSAYIKDSAGGSAFATGGTVTEVGGYIIHKFTGDGTFTVNNPGNIEVLVVGGGGGGAAAGGGGGAGGYVYNASFPVTAQAFSVTVGNGGGPDTNGGNSVFSTITATGGGKGGGFNTVGSNGGSGGGGGPSTGATPNAGGTGSQGNNGGAGGYNNASWGGGGGGGGASSVGTSGDTTTAGKNGGNGTANSISGTSITYACGGGGGEISGTVVGIGGSSSACGGNAQVNLAGLNATANTGGGGGGGSWNGTTAMGGGTGGSGIVIVRYPNTNTGPAVAHDGTPANSPPVVNGINGKARSFNGSNQRVLVDSTLGLGTTNATIESWAYIPSVLDKGSIVKVGSGADGYGIGVGLGNTTVNGNNFILIFEGVRWIDTGVTIGTGWHHLAMTIDSSGIPSAYIDGVYKGSYPGNNSLYPTANLTYIAGYSTRYFTGYIDEIRISNVARSAKEIAESYRIGGNYFLNKTISSTDLSTKQKLSFNVAADKPGTYLETIIGEDPYVNHQPDSNTVGLWRLDDSVSDLIKTREWLMDETSGTNVADTSANGANGTATGTSIIAGKYVNARSFPGTTSNHISITNSTSIFQDDSFTITAWIKPNNLAALQHILWAGASTGNGWGDEQEMHLTTATFNSASQQINNVVAFSKVDASNKLDGLAGNDLTLIAPYTDTTAWHHIAVILDGTNGYIYLDGVLVDSDTSNAIPTNTYNAAYIGRPGADTRNYNGAVDNLKIYNYPLSSSEISKDYQNYYLIDSSGNNYTGMPYGTNIVSGKIGKARSFNGTSDQIVLSSTPTTGTGSFTIDAWINTSATGVTQRIISYGQTGTNNAGLGFHVNTSNQVQLSLTNVAGPSSTVTVTDGKWHHVAVVNNAGTVQIYVDGMASGSSAAMTPNIVSTTTNRIGADIGGTGSWFNGSIDEVRVSNTARLPADIRAAYEYGKRSHEITIDFGAKLDSGNLISGSEDTSFIIDATYYGLNSKGSNLYLGDKIIVRENYNGTTYIAQGTINTITASTGATTVASWDVGSTFPASGFTVNADVFKWQTEYFDITGSLDTQRNAITNLSLRLTSGNEGRTVWLDDIKSVGNYLTSPTASTIASSAEKRYLQYRIIQSTNDYNVSSSVTSATLNFKTEAPNFAPIIGSPTVLSSTSIQYSFTSQSGGDDVVLTNNYGTVKIHPNNNSGAFNDTRAFATQCNPQLPNAADLDLDNDVDVVVPGCGSNLYVYKNNGDGTLDTPVNYTTGADPREVAIGDLSGDGIPDLAVSNGTWGAVSVFKNNGDGTFAAHQVISTAGNGYGIAIGDLNGDAKPDIAAVAFGQNRISVLENTSTGNVISFAARIDIVTNTTPHNVVIGNFNGDAYGDIAVTNNGSNNMSVFLYSGNGGTIALSNFPNKTDKTTNTTPRVLDTADVNNDGYLDIAVVNSGSANVSIFINNGNGTFADKVDYVTSSTPYSVSFGNLNGDLYPDMAVAIYSANTLSTLMNNGDGTFAAKTDYWTGEAGYGVVVTDMLGDQKTASGYRLYDSNNNQITSNVSCTSASCTETGLTPNTAYTRRVASYNNFGSSFYSDVSSSVYTLAATPPAPTLADFTTTTLSTTLGAGSNPAATNHAVYVQSGTVCTGEGGFYVAANGTSNGQTPIWQYPAAWGTLVIGGINLENSQYMVCTRAKNNNDVINTTWSGKSTVATGYVPLSSDFTIDQNMGPDSFTNKFCVDVGCTRYVIGVDNGPAGFWRFDEASGNVADLSTDANTGTPTGTTVVTGKYGFARSFDGIDDVIDTNPTFVSNTFTVEAWFTANNTHEIDTESTTGTQGVSGQKYLFGASQSGIYGGAGVSVGTNGISVYEHGNGYMPSLAVYSGTLPQGWNHVAIVYDNKTPSIYLNGELVRTGLTSTKAMVFAPNKFGGGSYGFHDGLMDDVRIYASALTQAQIQNDMNNLRDEKNTSKFIFKDGLLTLNSNLTLVAGSFDFNQNGSVFLAGGAELKPGNKLWIYDADKDSIPVNNLMAFGDSSPQSGRRRVALSSMNFVNDCNDQASQVWLNKVGGCYGDNDGDTYAGSVIKPNTTCLNSTSCNTATYASGGSGSATAYSTGAIQDLPGSDCNETGTNAANVYIPATCYIDADNDNNGDIRTTIGAVTCTNNANCLSATWSSLGEGTTATSGTYASSRTDWNDSNNSVYPNSASCVTSSFIKYNSDGTVANATSFDSDQGGTETKCTSYTNRVTCCYSVGDLGQSCPVTNTNCITATVTNCGVTGYTAGAAFNNSIQYGCGGGSCSGTQSAAGGVQSCK